MFFKQEVKRFLKKKKENEKFILKFLIEWLKQTFLLNNNDLFFVLKMEYEDIAKKLKTFLSKLFLYFWNKEKQC